MAKNKNNKKQKQNNNPTDSVNFNNGQTKAFDGPVIQNVQASNAKRSKKGK